MHRAPEKSSYGPDRPSHRIVRAHPSEVRPSNPRFLSSGPATPQRDHTAALACWLVCVCHIPFRSMRISRLCYAGTTIKRQRTTLEGLATAMLWFLKEPRCPRGCERSKTPSPQSTSHGLPSTTRRLAGCDRLAFGFGPPRVPRVFQLKGRLGVLILARAALAGTTVLIANSAARVHMSRVCVTQALLNSLFGRRYRELCCRNTLICEIHVNVLSAPSVH